MRTAYGVSIGALASVVGMLGAAACHGDSTSAEAVELRGTYDATEPGAYASLTFSDDTHFSAIRGTCTGAPATCTETGTYRVDASQHLLELDDGTTQAKTELDLEDLSFDAASSSTSSTPLNESVHVLGGGSLVSAADASLVSDAGAPLVVAATTEVVSGFSANGQPFRKRTAPPGVGTGDAGAGDASSGTDATVASVASPPAYSLAGLTYGGLWLEPRKAASYTQGLGEITTSAAGLRLFTELSGKPFVDGELPEWSGLLYSTDQVATASSPFGKALGPITFTVPAAATTAPDFSVYAQSACTNSTVLFNGFYYTYFEAFETLPTATLAGGATSPPLYVLALFVGRSKTLAGERSIYIGKNAAGQAQWAATPNTDLWAPVVRPYLTTHYQINGDALGPAGRTPVSWLGAKNGVYAAGAPSAVVRDGAIHLFYLDTSYSLSPGSFVSVPWVNPTTHHCTRALTANTFVNDVQDGPATCASAPGATVDPAISIPFTFTVSSTDPVTFDDTAPALLPGMYDSYNIRAVKETGDFVQFHKDGTAITMMRSKDGVSWCTTDTPDCQPAAPDYHPPANPTLADLSAYAPYFGSPSSGLVVSGDEENQVSLASPLYFGIWSSEAIASGNFSMGFHTARLFSYSSKLLAKAPTVASAPSGGPTDQAGDFNPETPLALETFYQPATAPGTRQFVVCGSDFASIDATYVEAFYSDPTGQMSYVTTSGVPVLEPPIYDNKEAAPYTLSQPAETYFGNTTRTCFAVSLVNPPAGWNLTLGFHDNASPKFFAVPVNLSGACAAATASTPSSCFDGTTPQAAPLSISTITRTADTLTFCGAGLYASRRGIYALLRYTAPTGQGGTQGDIYYFTADQKPGLDPSLTLTMSIDPTTRLRCGSVPLPASAQALIDQQHWQLVLGVSDPDSGQELRLPVP